ncbi:MAG: CBS domain-containing protein [Pirellulaceae bacterium]|nr:CBS domain-containing protein [Pirellulaceae bacterium]
MTSPPKISARTVAEIMTPRVETLSPGDTVKEAASMMIDSHVSTIPVVDGHQQCVGMLSRTDLTEMFLKEDDVLAQALDTDRLSIEWLNRSLDTSDSRTVRELMNDQVVTICGEQSLHVACQKMVASQIHHLPVVDNENQLVGIVSTFDVVKAVANA